MLFLETISYKGTLKRLKFTVWMMLVLPVIMSIFNKISNYLLAMVMPAPATVVIPIIALTNFPGFYIFSILLIQRLRDTILPNWMFFFVWLSVLPLLFIFKFPPAQQMFIVQFCTIYISLNCIMLMFWPSKKTKTVAFS